VTAGPLANRLIALLVLAALTAADGGADELRLPASGGTAGPGAARAAIDLGGLDARSAALMLSAQDAGDLDVAALAVPLPMADGGGRSRVTLVVDAGGASLLAAVPEEAAELITEVYAYAVGAALGFTAVLVVFSALRERLQHANVPRPFAGAPIALVSAGIMSLAFLGFAGMGN